MSNNDPELLARFQSAVGVGKVYGPYHDGNPKHRPGYYFTAYGRNVWPVMRRLWPHLGCAKRQQFIDATRRYRELPHTNPTAKKEALPDV